jgi:NAD dependent epimerase/dehydratase family enzyme
MSWIERDDLIRLIAHIMATPQLSGAVNATAPIPVRNAEFSGELVRAFHRPAIMTIPAAALRALGSIVGRSPQNMTGASWRTYRGGGCVASWPCRGSRQGVER